MNFAELTEDQYNEFLRLMGVYRREAGKCRKSKAYLAGCVMLGAALEAQLMVLVHLFQKKWSSAILFRRRAAHSSHC